MQLVLIHGLGQSPDAWDRTILFLKTNATITCPSLPELLSGKEPTYQNLYDAFCEYCDELPEPLYLCGLSLGATLAMNYAIDHPHQVAAIILIGAQYKMPSFLLTLQNTFYRFMKSYFFQETGFSKKDFIQLTNSMKTLDFTNDLVNITCDTSILFGEGDTSNKKASKELSLQLKQAELRVIPSAEHEVNLDNPKDLACVLDDFFECRGIA